MTRLPIWRRAGRELIQALLDLVLPATCGACRQPACGRLCAACAVHLQRLTEPVCDRCGEPLLLAGDRCRADHRSIAGLAWARAPFAYAGTGGALVRRWKLDGDTVAAAHLSASLAASLRDRCQGGWRRAAVVAVPLHRDRRRQRGFDQAEWLAAELARRLDLEHVAGAMRRIRATLPQGDPRVTSRERNVAGAFAVARPRPLRGRHVVLVDDVRTSGATARECAARLRAAGTGPVALATACRS